MRQVALSSGSSSSFGVDIEHHRHVAGLARLQRLLGEAEALDLVEIGRRPSAARHCRSRRPWVSRATDW